VYNEVNSLYQVYYNNPIFGVECTFEESFEDSKKVI